MTICRVGDRQPVDAAAAGPLLSVSGLQAFHGPVRVLHGIDLTVGRGGITALLGANGAGKTTTLRAICGMVRKVGAVVFDGRPIDTLATEDIARLGIAHVPQGRGTFERLSVEENLRLGAASRSDRRAIVSDLERVYDLFPRLAERRGQQAGTLSGGEQQMLALGRSLMLGPRLLLLDEPSFGLAPMIVEELFATLAVLNRQHGLAMLLVEQNASLALEFADEAVVIETGRLVASGPAREIARETSVRRAYLGY